MQELKIHQSAFQDGDTDLRKKQSVLLSHASANPNPEVSCANDTARNSPLLAPTSTESTGSGLMGKRVYVGFGVAGRKGVSVAVPVDILAVIIVAEEARRAVMATGITFLIADTHAKRTGNYDLRLITRAAGRRRHIIDRACQALGVPDPQVFLASQIEQDPLYQSLVEEATLLAKGDGEYFIREAD